MIVLGIDPGTKLHGWALLDVPPRGRARVMESGHGSLERFMCDHDKLDMVAVEKPVWMAMPKAGGPLMDTAFEAGKLYQQFSGYHQVSLVTFTAAKWRLSLCGRGNPSDAQVKACLALRVELPKRSNAHERDAMGIAWVAAQQKATRGVYGVRVELLEVGD